MAAILIEQVGGLSVGSHVVEITAIDPTDQDCLIGTIVTSGKGTTREAWNLNGLMRGGSDPVNLDMQSGAFSEVVSLAKKLGAPN